jgi:HAD superfamily hydrolase (TIGR01549 family)
MGRPVTINHVVFDLDGTLVDTREQIARSLVDALPPVHRHPDTIAALRRDLGISPRAALARFGVTNLSRYWCAHARNASVCELICADANKVLSHLARSGTGLSVLTSLPRHAALVVLEKTGLLPLFQRVDGAGCLRSRKPSPAALLAHVELLRIAPTRVAYVGDAVADIEMAKGANPLHSSAPILTVESVKR